MTDDRSWEDPIWRGRFRAYSPLELVKWAHEFTGSRTAKIALEVLDEKLVAMGITGAAPPLVRQVDPHPEREDDAAR